MKVITLSILGLFFTTLTFGQIGDSTATRKDPVDYIKKETIGGTLDFALKLEKENKGFYLYEGVAYNRNDFSVFLWGQAVKRLGIQSSKKARKLWEEINQRDLTKPEKDALTRGFNLKIK